MRFLSVRQMRAADAATMARPETAGMFLMFRAGRAVAAAAMRLARLRETRRIVCVAGRGNNGGDALVAARIAAEAGFSVHLLLAAAPEDLHGDAATAWRWFSEAPIPVTRCPTVEAWADPALATVLAEGVVVDGVLGTGCSRAPEGTVLEAIRWINARRPAAAILSIDLPSGMNGDTGTCPGEAVSADWTVTLARPKPCFANDRSVPLTGHLSVGDIGMPNAIADAESTPTGCRLIAGPEILNALPARRAESHKGDYGRLLVIGGSAAYPHAPVLAAAGALRAGVGLLTLAAPETCRAAAAAHAPEAIFPAIPLTDDGTLSWEALEAAGIAPERYDGIVLGPGLNRTPDTAYLTETLLSRYPGRLLLDADALTLLAELGEPPDPPEGQRRILTPHPGEAARLAGVSIGTIQRDRLRAVRDLADRYRATVVLKGSGTLVCEPDGEPWLNRTGNPGMAAGGSGDVLAGVIGALWVQGLAAREAACLGVWAHGNAGDAALWRLRTPSVTARDLITHLRFDGV